MGTSSSTVHVRPVAESELDDVIALAGTTLGWDPEQPNDAFFRWKHLENPFGRSPMWVAEVDGELAGFRTFLRWRFRRGDGSTATAVRAVDTATAPAHQGRGVFRALTMHAVEEMRAAGVDFVFNTPNDKSKPGYLKMGWVEVGRIPVRARVTSLSGLARMAKARAAANKWSEPVRGGEPAAEVLQDGSALDELLATTAGPQPGLETERTPDYLRWRYRFEPLHYRAVTLTDDLRRGVCVFRVRRRGPAREMTIVELLAPRGDRTTVRRLVAEAQRAAPADYLLCASPRLPLAARFVPVPAAGPVLTWRALDRSSCPPLDDWHLTLGDVELF